MEQMEGRGGEVSTDGRKEVNCRRRQTYFLFFTK